MRNLEDIMNFYEPEGELLDKARNSSLQEPLTEEEKERILQKALEKIETAQEEIPGEKQTERKIVCTGIEKAENQNIAGIRRKKKNRKTSRLVIIAACAAVLAMAGIGYAAGGLDSAFKAWFAPSTAQQLQQLETAGTAINKEVESNGVTMRVREAIGDESTVNVLIDFIAPKGAVLDANQYTLYRAHVDVDGGLQLGGKGLGYSFMDIERAQNQPNVYTTVLSLSSSQKLNGSKMTLDFKDLCVYKAEDEAKAEEQGKTIDESKYLNDMYRVVLPGEWKAEFTLNYEETSVKTYPKAVIQQGNLRAKVKELRVSPISLSIELRTNVVKEAILQRLTGRTSEQVSYFKANSEDIVVTMKDGAVLDQNSGGCFSESGRIKLDCQFGRMIDVNEIESITFQGQELWKAS